MEKDNNGNSTTASNDVLIKSTRSIQYNNQKLQYVQDATSLFSGCCCGILQLESLNGFTFFIIQYVSVAILFVIILCKGGKITNYFLNPIQDLIIENLFRELAGFLMTWTFVYALVV
ncbi:related to ER membrane protein complex subunit 6 [Saccharomycodes ludwigii]|uniref:ER membrane protein complex subunit 6 n=1 Tax=Saccharomycodes ludwigii TaxID=36035 RepID=A0A376B9N0_9ASCO|nr:hypothetical protein SCDLUD_004469 [Saccharomycodes ludwigii]KAH3899047.1 hypothetical protein SCDLUD_004469 [Saccharomycodes ludwigii]SSD60830.1 related to ER membrane protein complex subunit 6 [Saccharomycodes ludwigii]